MVNITVDKDVLKHMVELGMRFSIIWDKQEKKTPKEWTDKLDELNERWNNQRKIWWRKWLPQTRKLLPTHKEAWNKVYWDLYDDKSADKINNALVIVKIWLNNYIADIKKREEWWYWDHRFTLYEFIKQKNGLKRFVAF